MRENVRWMTWGAALRSVRRSNAMELSFRHREITSTTRIWATVSWAMSWPAFRAKPTVISSMRRYCNISNDSRRCQGAWAFEFCMLRHTFGDSGHALAPFERLMTTWIAFLSNRIGSARVLHHCGGVAHQTSLRSPSILMCYPNSPAVWGGG